MEYGIYIYTTIICGYHNSLQSAFWRDLRLATNSRLTGPKCSTFITGLTNFTELDGHVAKIGSDCMTARIGASMLVALDVHEVCCSLKLLALSSISIYSVVIGFNLRCYTSFVCTFAVVDSNLHWCNGFQRTLVWLISIHFGVVTFNLLCCSKIQFTLGFRV